MLKRKRWFWVVCGSLLLALFSVAAGCPLEGGHAAAQAALTATVPADSAGAVSATPSPSASPTIAEMLPQAKLLKLRLPVMGWLGTATREDWWAVAQKPGTWYYCEAVSNEFVPRLRVEAGGKKLTASDDARPGGVKATVSWTAAHEPWGYVVVSPAFRVGTYTLACSTGEPSPGTAVATDADLATPPLATPTLMPVTWRVVPSPPPTPVVTDVEIKVYYDLNGSLSPDPGEGVSGISIRALDLSGLFVGWAITDAQGEARLTLTSPDVARLYIPFLNWHQNLTPGQLNTVLVRVEPAALPAYWPAR